MGNKFKPSAYQTAIFDWVADGKGSGVVIAVAGSGKTTTAMNCLPLIEDRASVQLLAFNTAIARELNDRLDALRKETGRAMAGYRAGTFHSVCFGAVTKHLAGLGVARGQIKPDGNKLVRVLRDTVGEREAELYGSFVTKLVGLAKGEGVGALVPDTDQAWWDIIAHHDLYLESEDATEEHALRLARLLLNASNTAAERGDIDFDDMLYLVIKWRLRLWQHDWVIVDEAQDTNPVRRAIIKLLLRPAGRLLAIGDPRQAIYGFTGATSDAIELIKKQFNCREMPLTVSYRCARAIVEHAQEVVSHIEAAPGAAAGAVLTVPLAEALGKLTERDAVLCRNTAPLVTLAYDLLGRGVPCRVLGREIGAGLVSLIKKMRAREIKGLLDRLTAYREREIAKFTARGEEQKAEGVADRVACIETIIDAMPENKRTIPAVVDQINGMFADDNRAALTLSTAHKSKGREWDTVAIINPELMPSKWARQDWQMEQERNLMYVARTRAKDTLLYVKG